MHLIKISLYIYAELNNKHIMENHLETFRKNFYRFVDYIPGEDYIIFKTTGKVGESIDKARSVIINNGLLLTAVRTSYNTFIVRSSWPEILQLQELFGNESIPLENHQI